MIARPGQPSRRVLVLVKRSSSLSFALLWQVPISRAALTVAAEYPPAQLKVEASQLRTAFLRLFHF